MLEILNHKKITIQNFNDDHNLNLANTNDAWNWCKNFLISDSLEELRNYLNDPITFSSVPSSGKVAFNDDCSFPSLLLSRINTNFKRTTSTSKADFMVSDEYFLGISHWYELCIQIGDFIYKISKSYHIDPNYYEERKKTIGDEAFQEEQDEYNQFIENLSKLGTVKYLLETGCQTTARTLKGCLNWNKPVVRTRDFINCINSNLPKLTDEELNGICNMLEAVDNESYISGVNMIPYYDITDNEFPIILSLAKSIKIDNRCYTSGKSKNEKYLYFRLKTTPNRLSFINGNSQNENLLPFRIIYRYFMHKDKENDTETATIPLEMIRKYCYKGLIADLQTYPIRDYFMNIPNLNIDFVDISEGVQIPDQNDPNSEKIMEILVKLKEFYDRELRTIQMTPRVWIS